MSTSYQIDNCPLCNSLCTSGAYDFKDKKEVKCERCGNFRISLSDLKISKVNQVRNGYSILSYYAKNFLKPDQLLDRITIDYILENTELPSYDNKIDSLLNWICKESEFSTKSIDCKINSLIAIIGAIDSNELVDILDDIWEMKYIVIENSAGISLRKQGNLDLVKVHLTNLGLAKAKEVNEGEAKMIKIKLSSFEWRYDENKLLGEPGGFGEVYEGKDLNNQIVAIKKLKSNQFGSIKRELRIAAQLLNVKYKNVLGYYDYGFDDSSNNYYLVMPKAEKSLAEEISFKKQFNETESIKILLEILNGLKEIDKLVHRDLKPQNILLKDNAWKIADFGISRFIEESTSLNTLKNFLSAPFAAPEQWNLLKTTKATDIYALGCIGYCLLTGNPPFVCDDQAEYRDRHLNSSPSIIPGVSPKLNTILLMLLRKSPETRPDLDRVIQLLSNLNETNKIKDDALKELELVGAKEIDKLAKEEANSNKILDQQKRKSEVIEQSIQILLDIKQILFSKIIEGAPSAKSSENYEHNITTYHIVLGDAELIFQINNKKDFLTLNPLVMSKWAIINSATISVVQSKIGKEFLWNANLLYTDGGKSNNNFRWMELIFMTHPLISNRREFEPFALQNLSAIDSALAEGMQTIQLAANPVFIDDENIDSFCNRWISLFVKAYNGELKTPSSLPLKH